MAKEFFYIGDKIKIGRVEVTITKGDYIVFNGSCHQFIAGDRRTLYRSRKDRWSSYTSIMLSSKALKTIDLDSTLKIVESPEKSVTKYGLTKYYFK